MSSQCNDCIKIFIQSSVMAKIVQGKILKDFPRLNVTIGKESPRENSRLTSAVTVSDIYDSCVEPLTDMVLLLAVDKAVIYVLFDKDPAGNTHDLYDLYDWSQE